MKHGSSSRGRETVVTLVTDGTGGSLLSLAQEAAGAGIDRIQIREKTLSDRALFSRVKEVVEAATATGLEVFVNARPDIAALCGATGVQLPEDGLSVAEVKRAFPELLVGASRHSLEGARAAEKEGANFVVLGPVFASPGKEGRPLGLAKLAEVCRILRVPVHAIGGIDAASAPSALRAGAQGLMAIRYFRPGSLQDAARGLKTGGPKP